MSVQIVQQNGKRIALIESGEQNLTDVDSALEILGTVQYETGCDAMIFPKTSFPEEFLIYVQGWPGIFFRNSFSIK